MRLLFDRPRVFIGSAKESLDITFALQNILERDTVAVAWPDSVFNISNSTLSSLLNFTKTFDFAVFVLTSDDVTLIRDRTVNTTRANVIFELGLFFGALGSGKTFFIIPRGPGAPEIPSDLLGITPLTYDQDSFKINREAAVRQACDKILKIIKSNGLAPTHYIPSKYPERDIKIISADPAIGGSPYALDILIDKAENEIFIAAQNHYHVLIREEENFKRSIFNFLIKEPQKRRVRFLLCDPNSSAGINAWKSLFLKDNDYEEHLKIAYNKITSWVNDAKQSGLRLEAACIPLVPVSMNFIDPEDEQGLAVITPNIYEYKTKARTAYLLSKTEHNEIFTKYWQNTEYVFENPSKRI